jgi:hypothetical protein
MSTLKICASVVLVVFGTLVLPARAAGPDVIVGFVSDGTEDARTSGKIPGVPAGLVGLTASTTSCNAGDLPLQWQAANEHHPVITVNLYRLVDGRMEQIGKSWAKHGFLATNLDQCAGIAGVPKCQAGVGGDQLRPGCSDTYGAPLNAQASDLGPRSKIKASSGKFDFPGAKDLTGYPPSEDVERIMLMAEDELRRPNAKYFLEAHYVAADDAAAGNARNNVTYREVTPVLQGGIWKLRNSAPEADITRGQPAFSAWGAGGAQLAPDIVTDEGGGTKGYIMVGSNVARLPDGKFRYDYAIYNMNSDSAIQSFSVPAKNLDASSVGFRAVAAYGEIWSNDPWDAAIGVDRVTWSVRNPQDDKANALRWGTTYNFWIITGVDKVQSSATLGRFRPPTGGSASVTAAIWAPSQ